MSEPDALADLRDRLRLFAQDRDWDQFHTPKNLAAALSVEAAELLEHFQWLTAEQSSSMGKAELSAVAEELADVLLYLVRLADKLEVDLHDAALSKLSANAAKYPAAKARGNARKYDKL